MPEASNFEIPIRSRAVELSFFPTPLATDLIFSLLLPLIFGIALGGCSGDPPDSATRKAGQANQTLTETPARVSAQSNAKDARALRKEKESADSQPSSSEAAATTSPGSQESALYEIAQIFGSDDSVDGAVANAALPFIQALRENYLTYKPELLSTLSDATANPALRVLIIELLDENWSDPDAKHAVRNVFEGESLSSWLRGYAAVALARHQVDVGDEILEQYSSIEGEVKGLHTRALVLLNRQDAGELIAEEAKTGATDSSRLAAIEALGDFSSESLSHLELLEKIALTQGLAQSQDFEKSDFVSEAFATRAVAAISVAADVGTSLLLELAENESLAVNVRIAAIDGLAASDRLSVPELEQLTIIEDRVLQSNLSETSKSRLQQAVQRVTNEAWEN